MRHSFPWIIIREGINLFPFLISVITCLCRMGRMYRRDFTSDITVIDGTPKHAYLAATSGMDFIVKIGRLNNLSFSGTKEDGWYIPEAKQAMQAQTLAYAGKYNAPDVEQMLAGDCDLAIESTMILHNPEVKEQLETCGIPVIVEHSS